MTLALLTVPLVLAVGDRAPHAGPNICVKMSVLALGAAGFGEATEAALSAMAVSLTTTQC